MDQAQREATDMGECFPQTTDALRKWQLLLLTNSRERFGTVPEVRRGARMYMLSPNLQWTPVEVTIVEEQVAVPHEHLDCPANCGVRTDWTPIVRITGEGAEIHVDSTQRLFNTVEEAHRIVLRLRTWGQ